MREDYWQEEHGEHEVTFAIDLYTMKMHRPDSAADHDAWKKQWDPRKYLTGTIDWLGVDGGEDWVDDLKTGDWWVDPRSGQILSYAFVPWVLKGCPESNYWVRRSITHWPWYPLNGPPRRYWASPDGKSYWADGSTYPITALDLLCHRQDLIYALEHPNEANVVDHVFHPFETYKDGRRKVEEMSPCTFCDAREPDWYSSWFQHFEHRAWFACRRGVISRLVKGNK